MQKLGVVGILMLCLLLGLGTPPPIASALSNSENHTPATPSRTRTPISAEQGEQLARTYLNAHAAQYTLTPADLAGLEVAINFADADSGNRYVKFKQTAHGIEIYQAMLNVTLKADGTVLYVGNRGIDNATQRVNTRNPRIGQDEAIVRAATALGLPYTPETVRAGEPLGDVNQRVQFTGGDLSNAPISVRLLYHPHPNGTLRLAWALDIYPRDGLHWWNIYIDAVSGEVLGQTDRVIHDEWNAVDYASGTGLTHATPSPSNPEAIRPFKSELVAPLVAGGEGSYRVYALPTESPSHATPPAPADGRTLEVNPAHPGASPFGWHDTNGVIGHEFTVTRGNNAYAYTDTDANNLPDTGSSPDGGSGLVFESPLDLTLTPDGYRPAAVINLFYWANTLHDIAYIHGFTEPAGNFQENNYGNGGLGNDSIQMQAQDGALTNNARYFHTPDGTSPSVEMFLWTPPTPDRDGDLDAGIILHEYGHGISLRLTGDGLSCLNNAEQMGEGWSDFQSVMVTQKPGDTAAMARGLGTYVINQPPTGPGVRVAPYTTDMTVNPYTYGRLPELVGGSALGFLWNTMLWDLNWKLIDIYGYNPDLHGDWTTGGNNLTYRLVHDGLKIQPCTPGFVDGRDAILAADEALTEGANQCPIWEAFARRGLGFSASQGSPNSTSDGTEAFDLPPECTSSPDIQVTPDAFVEVHTTPQTTTDTLSLQNAGAATLTWIITEAEVGGCSVPTDIEWLALTPAGGSTAGGGTTSITLTYNSLAFENGVYSGTLCIASDDPDSGLLEVPITLHIGPATALELSRFGVTPPNTFYLAGGMASVLALLGIAMCARQPGRSSGFRRQ